MNSETVTGEGRQVGRSVRRREDAPLLRGDAQFTDDIDRRDVLYMTILRSQYGHARIEDIDVDDAMALDPVVGVYTAEDVAVSGRGGSIRPTHVPHGIDDPDLPVRERKSISIPYRPLLARGRVRYTGEPVAAVVAEDRYAAHDAIDLIEVSYDRLDAITDPHAAVEPDAPVVHRGVDDNVAFDWEIGDADAVEAAFRDADRTVSVDIDHQRVAPVTMEPRAALSEYDPSSGALTVHLGTQSPHAFRDLLVDVLGLEQERIRVIAPAVGGGFGCKSKFYPAEPLTAWCAIETRRPVKWQATRTESYRSDIQGRGRTVRGELAFDEDGTICGLEVDSHADLGAYVSRAAAGTRTGSFIDVLSGQYRIPAIHCRVRGVFTTMAPVDSYRGSSRPMTILTVERLVDLAARELDIDPVEFRRTNFVLPESFPYETPVGQVYDSGEYARALDRTLDLLDYESVRERQTEGRTEGRYLGVGFSCLMDNAGTGSPESARIRFDRRGRVSAYCGTADQGQGHRTTFSQLVADLLGVPLEDVEFEEGDSADVPVGGGSSGSRSVVMGGEALRAASEEVTEQARRAAAHHLEVAPDDLEFEDGAFSVRGAGQRSIHIQEVARLASGSDDLPAEVPDGLDATATRRPDATFPFGTHAAVVEVDPDTGDVSIRRYVAVDDCGVQINPKLVEGQVVGGVVQGIGQALFEEVVYDDTGTVVSGSMQDYNVPKAVQIPDIVTDHTVTPSPYNELGVKGVGEGGATGAPAAIANAVADALEPFGIDHLNLPITPENVWRATNEHGRGGASGTDAR